MVLVMSGAWERMKALELHIIILAYDFVKINVDNKVQLGFEILSCWRKKLLFRSDNITWWYGNIEWKIVSLNAVKNGHCSFMTGLSA